MSNFSREGTPHPLGASTVSRLRHPTTEYHHQLLLYTFSTDVTFTEKLVGGHLSLLQVTSEITYAVLVETLNTAQSIEDG